MLSLFLMKAFRLRPGGLPSRRLIGEAAKPHVPSQQPISFRRPRLLQLAARLLYPRCRSSSAFGPRSAGQLLHSPITHLRGLAIAGTGEYSKARDPPVPSL